MESFIIKLKDIYSSIINFIDSSEDSETEFEELIQTFNKQNILENIEEVRLIFQLISEISNNHHRTPDFFDKFEKIFKYLIKESSSSISYYIPDYSNYNKRILFLLLEKKLLKPDKSFLNKYLHDVPQILYYLYPSVKQFLVEQKRTQIEKEIFDIYKEEISTFAEKCQIGENDSYICSLIRSDSVEEFVSYVNKSNLSLSSEINSSIYETNSFLIDKTPTLIEYAAFFGSIQIFQYLKYNNVSLTSSLWLYSIHSKNAELIHLLEYNNIKPPNCKDQYITCLKESIKCHHNDIAEYIKSNYLENDKDQFTIYENTFPFILYHHNYAYFPKCFELDDEFFYLCKYNYQILVNFFLHNKETILKKYANKRKINEEFKVLIFYYKIYWEIYKKKTDPSILKTMEKIALPPSVTFIKDEAFNNYKALKQISIPSSVASIGRFAFSGCTSLAQISIPSSVTSIGNSAFHECETLAQISIPSSVTTIGDCAFSGCTSLAQISIPSSVTSIGNSAFHECETLAQISIPSSVISIGNYVFAGCTSLTLISILSSITSIKCHTFDGCTSLTKISIPSSVTSIGDDAFSVCTSLTHILIPSSVISIGSRAFEECKSLTQISIPSSVTTFGYKVFIGIKTLEITGDIMHIPDTLFKSCHSLAKISIPSSVTSIGNSAFQDCTSLTEISIPSSVTSIGNSAFQDCTSLTEISIPSSVTSIGYSAFQNCTSLKQILISSSVTSIGERTFLRCSSLTQISIPSSVTSIGNNSFKGCTLLAQISIPLSVTLIGNSAFQDCLSLKQASIPSSVVSVEKDVFSKCASLTQIQIPSSVISIGEGAFSECSSLQQVSIPSSVTSIGKRAFVGCSSLKQVSIPSSVISIGDYAFVGCSSLAQVSIPSSVTSIGKNAFDGCPFLPQVPISSSVTSNNDSVNDCCSSTQISILSSNENSFNKTSTTRSSYIDIAQKLFEKVDDEGLLDNEMSNLLFSSFNDTKVWSPIDIKSAMPNSVFYCAKINSNLSIFNVDDIDDNKEGYAYLIVRYTKDDISKYLDYLKFEFNSYTRMEKQVNEIIIPIGYTQNISEKGFIFAFVTSTILTLDNSIDFIKKLPLKERFAYAMELIDNVYESFNEQNISGFHITPETILFNKHEGYMGIIGFIGEIDNLKLCSTSTQFLYDNLYSPSELKKTRTPRIRAPNSISDVYGLAMIAQFIIGDEIQILVYKNMLSSALQRSPKDRLSLNELKIKMHKIQKEVLLLENDNPVQLNKQQIRLAYKIRKLSIPIKTEEGYPQIFKLPSIVTRNDSKLNFRKVIIGPNKNLFKEEVKILIVGSLGCGKTTFLNGIVNYLYGVQWTDDFRFKCVSEEDYEGRNWHESLTTDITAYTLYWQPGFAVPYTVTLIDTPGFGDFDGFLKDRKIINQIESLFKNENDCGIDSLNAVAFTIQSRVCKLPPPIPYFFESIVRMFGKDMVNNFIIISTFCDAGKPEVLYALEYHKIPTNFVSKFNNSAIFAKCTGDDARINQMFWEIGQANYDSLFINVSKMSPMSLCLTKDVLDMRKKTNEIISSIYQNIRDGITKMVNIEEICTIIKQYKKEIEINENFNKTVDIHKASKIDLKEGEYATNCRECSQTCHYPCNVLEDNLKNCSVMDNNGHCNICGCHWTKHCIMEFKWELYEFDEKITLNEIIQQYGDKKSTQQNSEKIFENALNDYINTWLKTAELVIKCKDSFNILHKIALRPIVFSEIDCIRLLIKTEEQSLQPGWRDMIKWLEELLKQQELFEANSDDNKNINMPQKERIKVFLEEKIRQKLDIK